MNERKGKGGVSAKMPLGVLLPTLLYWFWESKVGGNIRVDLLIIYPLLFCIYTRVLWNEYRRHAVLIASILMIINFLFFIFSYSLFSKNPG